MIRSQQTQLQHLQQNQQQNPQSGAAVIDDTPSSERSTSFFPSMPLPSPSSHRPSISSLSNRPPSLTTSPNIRPHDVSRGSDGTEAFPALRESSSRRGSRDESAFYQAEAAMLGRENQMLRQRIRELGKSCHTTVSILNPASTLRRTPLRSGDIE